MKGWPPRLRQSSLSFSLTAHRSKPRWMRSKRRVNLRGCERTRSIFWELGLKETLMPQVDHCIRVLRDALCFTSVIQSWGPEASPLIIRCTCSPCLHPYTPASCV
eukprot:4843680-Pyramimonas_sp.AAC.1